MGANCQKCRRSILSQKKNYILLLEVERLEEKNRRVLFERVLQDGFEVEVGDGHQGDPDATEQHQLLTKHLLHVSIFGLLASGHDLPSQPQYFLPFDWFVLKNGTKFIHR